MSMGQPSGGASADAPAMGMQRVARFVRVEPIPSTAFLHSFAASDSQLRELKARLSAARDAIQTQHELSAERLREVADCIRQRNGELVVQTLVLAARAAQAVGKAMEGVQGCAFEDGRLAAALKHVLILGKTVQGLDSSSSFDAWMPFTTATVQLSTTMKAVIADFDLASAKAMLTCALQVTGFAEPGGSAAAPGMDLGKTRDAVRKSVHARTSSTMQYAVEEPRNFKEFAGFYLIPIRQLDRRAYVRQEVQFEIVYSEYQYVADLELMCEVFARPLKAETTTMNADQHLAIFCNLEQLLSIHQTLLADLQTRQMLAPFMASIVEALSPCISQFVDAYKLYCANHAVAVETLSSLLSSKRDSSRLVQFLDRASELPTVRRLPLEGYLIKPVQRLCKYPLLLRELLKSSVEADGDMAALQSLTEQLERLVARVNETKRAADEQRQLIDVLDSIDGVDRLPAAPLRVIAHGMLVKLAGTKVEERYCVLFDTSFVWCKKTRLQRKVYELRNVARVADISLSSTVPDEARSAPPGSTFSFTAGGKSYVWQAASAEDCAVWLGGIKTAQSARSGVVII